MAACVSACMLVTEVMPILDSLSAMTADTSTLFEAPAVFMIHISAINYAVHIPARYMSALLHVSVDPVGLLQFLTVVSPVWAFCRYENQHCQ